MDPPLEMGFRILRIPESFIPELILNITIFKVNLFRFSSNDSVFGRRKPLPAMAVPQGDTPESANDGGSRSLGKHF